nr:methyltransferase domain-containing protein [Sulfobacillus harzensis]
MALTFDRVARQYDKARPAYPTELTRDLTQLAGIGAQSRVLEIGAGTGQFTQDLLTTGAQLVAVEMGPHLAQILREKMSQHPNVSVVNADFEIWPLPTMPFDLVVSATAFHWLDESTQKEKTARALRTGGYLAVISTHPIQGGTDTFYDAVQPLYETFLPSTHTKPFRLSTAEEVAAPFQRMAESSRYRAASQHRYPVVRSYSAETYTRLLGTYSDHLMLGEDALDGLLQGVYDVIERRYGGAITIASLHILEIFQRQ